MSILDFIFKHKHVDESFEDQEKEVRAWIDACFQKYPEAEKKDLASTGCDTVQGGKGEYGRDLNNPIPVNGPEGELKYLGMLTPMVFFHRLGSVFSAYYNRHLDVYELVSIRSRCWDILYFDMFHPRRSTLAPKSFKLADYHKLFCSVPFVRGTNRYDVTFPHAIPDILKERIGGSLGEKIANKVLPDILGKNFKRPANHYEQALKILKVVDGQTALGGQPIVKTSENTYRVFTTHPHDMKRQDRDSPD